MAAKKKKKTPKLTKTQSSSPDNESLADLLIAPCPKEEVVVAPEEKRLADLGIPTNLRRFTWLHTDCNELTQQNREKIVAFMTGKYTATDVEKEDVLLKRVVDVANGLTKDTVFRMMFASKNGKKSCLVEESQKESCCQCF